jgi:hypothetical protein
LTNYILAMSQSKKIGLKISETVLLHFTQPFRLMVKVEDASSKSTQTQKSKPSKLTTAYFVDVTTSMIMFFY